MSVGAGDHGVIEGRADMNLALLNVLALSSTSANLLLRCCHNSYPSLLLLICDGALGTLAGTSVSLGSLATNGQATTVAETTVAADLSQALAVKAGLAAKVTFDDVVLVDAITQLGFFLVGEVFNSGVGIDTSHFENLGCACSANTVDISETDLDSLVLGQVNAGYTCHIIRSSFR